MWRLYLLGIIYLIMALNIPEVRDNALHHIQIYRPRIDNTISMWNDRYSPAIISIINDLTKKQTIINGNIIDTVIDTPVDTKDNWSLSHKPSITADQFDSVLREYNSPAVGIGAHVTRYAESKNIDSAYILYIFIHESTAGTNKAWAGYKPDGSTTHNIGNIICAGYNTCYGAFRDYDTWEQGFDAAVDLLADYRESGLIDIDGAINRWAPPIENDTAGYVNGLHENVSKWRDANRNIASIQKAKDTGNIHEVVKGMQVTASFDTVDCRYWGFQANCQHWGTDLAVCADCEVYAPVDCTYIMTDHYYDSAKLGDYLMCRTMDGYEFYSGHLKNAIKLTAGDFIAAGTVIGYGNEAVVGPHTHIQLRDPNGNLTDFMKYWKGK